MTPKEAYKEFEEQLAALEVVVLYVSRTISLLRRSVEGKIPITNKQDSDMIRVALTHYIVNNLNALFDDKDRKVNSLKNITKRFEGHFPTNVFSEYAASVEEFRAKHLKDLERIQKNRHLSTAHLGASREERLGWPPHVAKNMDRLLGTKSSVAKSDSLRFITPYQLFEMPIIENVPRLEKILEELNTKVVFAKVFKK